MPDLASSLNHLAGLHCSQGRRYGEAEPLVLRAIAIFSQSLGDTHPNTQPVRGNVSRFLQAVVQGDRASELSDHPVTRSRLQQLQTENA
jgi:hypothetical protein